MRLAFITSSNFSLIPAGEKAVLESMAPEITYELIIWDQIDFRTLRSFDRIFIRTCWDYHLKFSEFRGWLDELARRPFKVTNPVESIKWNSRKSYLFDLQKSGIPIVTTYLATAIPEILTNFPRRESFIVKPLISASAYQLRKLSREDLIAISANLDSNSIVQPFMSEVEDAGEWSLIFFNKEYSHAALKKAKKGDFRVQSDFGGRFFGNAT